jgi:FkbM family methyltransferase
MPRVGRAAASALLERRLYGRRRYFRFFRTLHRVALAGMNHGCDDPRRNGEYRLLDEFARKWHGHEPVVLDVGAHVGGWTAEVSNRVPNARIYAFEPTERYAELEARVGSVARTYRLALSDRDGEAEMYAPPGADTLTSLHARDLRHVGLPAVAPVEMVTVRRLDTFVAEEGLASIDLLKLDVEGHELAVMRGAGDWLTDGRISAIQFEFGGTALDARVFFRDIFYLLHEQYDVLRILRDGVAPVERYRERDEIFTYANYLAVLREPEA